MKKIIALLVVLLGLTGCSDPKTELEKASSKMNELDNYNMEMVADIQMGAEGFNVNMKLTMNGDYDAKNNTAKMTMTGDILGEQMSAEMYVINKDNKTTTYTKEDDKWSVSEAESEAQGNFEFDVFKNAKEIKKVKYDGEGKKYQIVLSEEDIKKIMSSASEMEDLGGSVSLDDIEIFVYVNDGYITQMDMNMPMKVSEEGVNVEAKANLTMKFSKFNEVGTITIPQEAIDGATNQDEEMKKLDIEMYAYSYMSAIYAEMPDDGEFTDTTLEYDGPQPTDVSITIKDFSINGTITIDGYVATIVDDEIESIVKAN